MIINLFVVPSGPRSRVYIRLSLPQFEGRLGRALESNDIQDALNAIEEFLVCLSPVHYFECFWDVEVITLEKTKLVSGY